MKKTLFTALLLLILLFSGCDNNKPLVWVWYPNECTPEKAEARAHLIKIISDTLGRPIEEQLTTDYNIAIEAMVNNNAAFSWFGGEGYVQAHAKNPNVLPMVVDSGASGTLKDAKYYSMIVVLKGNESAYMKDGKYALDNIAGKKFSFVSQSSTSGFRVPTSTISSYFSKLASWQGLKSEDLVEGGAKKLFSEVLYGQSHQGSMLNLILKKADVAAFCDTCVAPAYAEWVSGTSDLPKAGDIIRIKQGAADPFNKYTGTEMVLIASIPVLNAPMVVNTGLVSKDQLAKLVAALTSDKVSRDEKIFVPKGSQFVGIGLKQGMRFVTVEDAWYDPIRELSGMK